ncbi:hypothetical protein LDENG_00178410 [Lucifuga dentata]|nr:hypothetical protein LDENG_00178410 [Lucifuga dentata]
MTEGEYTDLQHIIQDHTEAQEVDPHKPDDGGPTVISQALDLSTVTDDHCLMSGLSGDKTSISYGEVSGYVLSINRSEDNLTEISSKIKRPHQLVRVCLEKRLDSLAGDAAVQQDNWSAVLSNLLTMLQQSAETQEAVFYPQMETWMKTDYGHLAELSSLHGGGLSNPVISMCGQVFDHIPHIVDPKKHQGLIHPKNFSFTNHPKMINTNAQCIGGSGPMEHQRLVIVEGEAVTEPIASRMHIWHGEIQDSNSIKAVPDARGLARERGSNSRRGARSCGSSIQSRERHNNTERERRRKIRSCCDKLNTLVPFCHPKMDKASTLQWTTAFLSYVNKVYGDTLKEEFQNAFVSEKARFSKPDSSSDRDQAEAPSIHFTTEQ